MPAAPSGFVAHSSGLDVRRTTRRRKKGQEIAASRCHLSAQTGEYLNEPAQPRLCDPQPPAWPAAPVRAAPTTSAANDRTSDTPPGAMLCFSKSGNNHDICTERA